MALVAPLLTVRQHAPSHAHLEDGYQAIRPLLDKLRLRNYLLGDTGQVVGVHTTVPTASWSPSAAAAAKAKSFPVTAGSGTPRPGQTFTIAGDTTVYRVTSYVTGSPNVLSFVQDGNRDAGLAQVAASGAAITWIAVSVQVDVSAITQLDLVSSGDGTHNDTNAFKLTNGVHGQELRVSLKTKGGASDAVTLVEDTSVTIVQADGTTGVASITFSAAAKFALLRFEVSQWRIVATDATVA